MSKALSTLTVAQALGLAAAPLVVMVAGVVGRELAPFASLATLPLTTMVVGTALTSAPAALLMQRVGRRLGFAIGATVSVLGGLAGAAAIGAASFAGLCFATLLIGAHLAFVMQYRFAAAEAAGPAGAARAVALVLAGGVVAGLLGPELGRYGQHLLPAPWAGSFLLVAVTGAVLTAALLLGLGRDMGSPVRTVSRGTPAFGLLRQRTFRLAVAAGITAYAGMSLIMTATPLEMHLAGFGVDESAIVLQAHVVAMYAPALAAGPLASRFGIGKLMVAGLVAMAMCAGLGLAGGDLGSWIAALVLLGVGWNLLFLGGTVALARGYPGEERFRAQALNDALIFGTQAVASLGAGAILASGGWRAVNAVALVPVLLMSALLAGHAVAPAAAAGRPEQGL